MVTRLDLAYDRQVHQLRSKVLRVAVAHWDGLGSWRDADYRRTLRVLVPKVEAAQQQVANLTDAYIRKQALASFGKVKDGQVFPASTERLRGVAAAEVYRRPFASMYAALSEGKSVSASLGAGRERLADVVSSGMQLSKTHSAREALGKSGFTKYMRVLTGRENCALCVIASTQRYHKADLLPIHPGCDCGVKGFAVDPGDDYQVINEALLESTHDQISARIGSGERGARQLGRGKFTQSDISDYTDLIVSREHGELGPVLTWRGDKFTGPDDL